MQEAIEIGYETFVSDGGEEFVDRMPSIPLT